MKMNKKTKLLASSALVATVMSFTVASAAFAEESDQSSLLTQAKITMQQACDIVTNANTGSTVDEIKLKKESDGTATYEIGITNSDSTKSEVKVNAENETIIQTKAKANKEEKNAERTALKSQQQTLNTNWASMTAEQKEQVYALKDAEFDAQIVDVKSHVAAGYKTQAEVDTLVSQIQELKVTMRTSGAAPAFKSIVNLPTVSGN